MLVVIFFLPDIPPIRRVEWSVNWQHHMLRRPDAWAGPVLPVTIPDGALDFLPADPARPETFLIHFMRRF
jgi:hypothetical protein